MHTSFTAPHDSQIERITPRILLYLLIKPGLQPSVFIIYLIKATERKLMDDEMQGKY